MHNAEGNIYYNTNLFDMVGFGAEEIGMKDKGYVRKLFWVKLRVKSSGHRLFVSTVHFTWYNFLVLTLCTCMHFPFFGVRRC